MVLVGLLQVGGREADSGGGGGGGGGGGAATAPFYSRLALMMVCSAPELATSTGRPSFSFHGFLFVIMQRVWSQAFSGFRSSWAEKDLVAPVRPGSGVQGFGIRPSDSGSRSEV